MKPNLTDTDITNTDKGAILRHAPAKYINQKITPPQTKFSNKKHQIADFKQLSEKFLDLREDKIQELKQNIETYLEENRETLKDKKIRIWISPFGRTMETGKILLEALEKRGIFIDSISLVEQLEEVRNFHRPMLNAFANWGTFTWWDKEYEVDKSITNPNNLSNTNYFFEGYYRKVDSEYLEKLGLKERITEVETYQEITERSQRDLTRILNAVDNETFLFIVSHQAFTDRIYVKKDNYATKGQQPGEFCKVDDKFLWYLQV